MKRCLVTGELILETEHLVCSSKMYLTEISGLNMDLRESGRKLNYVGRFRETRRIHLFS